MNAGKKQNPSWTEEAWDALRAEIQRMLMHSSWMVISSHLIGRPAAAPDLCRRRKAVSTVRRAEAALDLWCLRICRARMCFTLFGRGGFSWDSSQLCQCQSDSVVTPLAMLPLPELTKFNATHGHELNSRTWICRDWNYTTCVIWLKTRRNNIFVDGYWAHIVPVSHSIVYFHH